MKQQVVLALLVLWFALAVLSVFQVKASITGVSPPVSGTWTINADTYLVDEDIIVNGSIFVQAGYKFRLTNSTLRMNLPSSDGQYGIRVEGTMDMFSNSKVLNYTNYAYYFTCVGVAYFDHFEIAGAGYNAYPASGWEYNASVYLYAANNVLYSGSIHDGKAGGLFILQYGNSISDVTIYGSPNTAWVSLGIWLLSPTASHDNTFTNVNVTDFWRGINEDGYNNKFTNTRIHDITTYGMASYGDNTQFQNTLVYNANVGFTISGVGSGNTAKNVTVLYTTVYNTTFDGMAFDFWVHDINVTNFLIYNTGVGMGFGQNPYDLSISNGIIYGVSLTSSYGGDKDYPAINVNENVTDLTLDNVVAYSNKYGLGFRGDSIPMGTFGNITVKNSDFRGNYLEDIYVWGNVGGTGNLSAATMTDFNISNTYYDFMRFDGTGYATAQWNTTAEKVMQVIYTNSSNSRTGVSSYSFTSNATMQEVTSQFFTPPGYTVTDASLNCGEDGFPAITLGLDTWTYNSTSTILTFDVDTGTQLVQFYWYPITPPEIITGVNNLTFYLRSDFWTINTVTAYQLDESPSTNLQSVTVSTNSMVTAYYGFRLWLVHTAGTTTEVTSGTPYSLMSFNTNHTGSELGYWTATPTAMVMGYDALKLTVYSRLGVADWTATATYISTVPIFTKKILNQTWTFEFYVDVHINSTDTVSIFYFGDEDQASRVFGVGFQTPLTQEIQAYYLMKGDLVQWLLYGYTAILGQGLFFGIILLIGCGSTYVRYRNFAAVLMIFIIFGGAGGLVWAFVPAPAVFVVWVFMLIGLAVLIFRVIR